MTPASRSVLALVLLVAALRPAHAQMHPSHDASSVAQAGTSQGPAPVAPRAHPHSEMGGMAHDAMGPMTHDGMAMPATRSESESPQSAPPSAAEHRHDAMPAMEHDKATGSAHPHATSHNALPPPSDADRAAAFPPLRSGHAAHDRELHSFWLVDRMELRDSKDSGAWQVRAWWGGDSNRLWLRSEGERDRGHTTEGNVELLFGHALTPWWELVVGARQEGGGGPTRSSAAIGVQGTAPYKIDVEATAYLSEGGHSEARLEAEYATLLTHRLVLQWRGEATAYGREDVARGRGAGLSTVELGARLRYELNRQFAPYLGVEHERAYGDTADLHRADHESVDDIRVVAGVRFWF